MKISVFTSDRAEVESWLKNFVSTFSNEDANASYWFHPESNGFGIVVSDFLSGGSGEFHLFSDGRVSMNVEHGTTTVASGWSRVAHFHEFEERFRSFQAKVAKPEVR
jgi:hypothetical protein